ncbi:Hypothetical_protein [Hexamita inflata]|uniref:Hypothetical_protein n=1 Tax=Hexamita inflata TaxID=28002 RepID=A0AA86PJ53_9EUKA|nr:Hypothetical protein HINF_LOCUS28355 [Hexamita inflata]
MWSKASSLLGFLAGRAEISWQEEEGILNLANCQKAMNKFIKPGQLPDKYVYIRYIRHQGRYFSTHSSASITLRLIPLRLSINLLINCCYFHLYISGCIISVQIMPILIKVSLFMLPRKNEAVQRWKKLKRRSKLAEFIVSARIMLSVSRITGLVCQMLKRQSIQSVLPFGLVLKYSRKIIQDCFPSVGLTEFTCHLFAQSSKSLIICIGILRIEAQQKLTNLVVQYFYSRASILASIDLDLSILALSIACQISIQTASLAAMTKFWQT